MPSSPFSLTVQMAADRIRTRNDQLCAFVTTCLDEAATETGTAADGGALQGVPFSLKDAWDTAGIVTTGGSYRFRDRVPEGSAPIYDVVRDAGAVLLGKTNLSDLSVSPEASSHVGGATRNPHDLTRTAGGSSGGAAAAVADGMTAFDWGSDIGGSIRVPSAFCGVHGMRLSSETWPMSGYFPAPPGPMKWMNGQGPITKTLAQMRLLLEVAAPHMRVGDGRNVSIDGAWIYAPKHGRWPGFADDVRPWLQRCFNEVRDDHGLPRPHEARNLAIAVWASHFDELLESDPMSLGEGVGAVLGALVFGGRRDKRLHPRTAEVMVAVMAGRYTLFRDRDKALAEAHAYRQQVSEAWQQGYVVVAPVCAYPAPRIGTTNRNPHLLDCAFAGNVADSTALTIPCGRFDDGLPRGIQLMGPPGSEFALIDLAEHMLAEWRAQSMTGR